MIFLTVGSQMPFDRLVQAVDAWAGEHPGCRVVAQVGRGAAPTQHVERHESLAPAAFREQVLAAGLLVAHAGMGSVLTALELDRPLVMLPRLGARRETRNDHQLATLRALAGRPGLYAAADELALVALLERWRCEGLAGPGLAEPSAAHRELLAALSAFVDEA